MRINPKSLVVHFEKSPVQSYGLAACLLGGALCGYLLLSSTNGKGSPTNPTAPVDNDEPL